MTALGSLSFMTLSGSASDGTAPPQGLLADGIGLEGGDRWEFIKGYWASASRRSNSEAIAVADNIRNEFDANSDRWLAYGNWIIEEFDDADPLGTVSLGVDIVNTGSVLEDDDVVETVLEATYDDSEEQYTFLEWRIEENDETDYQARIEDADAEMALEELQWYRREFIDVDGDDHGLPNEKQASNLAGRAASFLDSDSQHVLELLIGEVN